MTGYPLYRLGGQPPKTPHCPRRQLLRHDNQNDIEGVKFLVLDKFKTQRDFARAVGISEASDFEALRSYQSIVLENLTVLSKVVGGRGLFGSQGHVGRPLGIHV